MEDTSGWSGIESLSFATAIRESPWLFPAIETAHVIALALVIGTIATLDLRLLGIGSRQEPVAKLARELLPWTWSAFALAAVSGLLMFVSNAGFYAGNLPFRLKLALLALAAANMLAFHATTFRSVASWSHLARPPLAARIAGGLSLALWVGVVTFGRWIGFS